MLVGFSVKIKPPWIYLMAMYILSALLVNYITNTGMDVPMLNRVVVT